MPSACFRNVCKQMAKMHEAISDLLPEEQTQVRLDTPTSASVRHSHSSKMVLCVCVCVCVCEKGSALRQMCFSTDVVPED